MYNTILIKRRLPNSPLDTIPVLSGGEIAFNEKNNTFYYGASAATPTGVASIAIGGDGAFVTIATNQGISGNKTFTGQTSLSSTTFSLSSTIDAGANKITNLAPPEADADATTKKYVDDKLVAGDYVKTTTAQTISGIKTFFDDAYFNKNLTVTGNLSVLGDSTTIETTVATTSAFVVHNAGVGPALKVTQTGSNDVATFYDDANVALTIKDGGNIGIGLNAPSEKLTVAGNVSASGNLFGVNGTFIGNLKVTEGSTFYSNISGTAGVSQLFDFIIDCGSF